MSVGITREAYLHKERLLPVFHAADLWEVNVQDEEQRARQKCNDSNGDPIVARVIILVENAMQPFTPDVNVAFVHYGPKHYNGEYLQRKQSKLHSAFMQPPISLMHNIQLFVPCKIIKQIFEV